MSDFRYVEYGVPLGTFLEPILFNNCLTFLSWEIYQAEDWDKLKYLAETDFPNIIIW